MEAAKLIEQAIPGLPRGSPIHRDALSAATRLSRHANQGAPTAGVEATHIGDLLRNVMRNALLQKIMMQQGTQGPQPGPGPQNSPMQAASAAPMPSTPLPGA